MCFCKDKYFGTLADKHIRFYDPENNLVEIGETIPCFVKRFFNQGMSAEEISKRTSVPIQMVNEICQKH